MPYRSQKVRVAQVLKNLGNRGKFYFLREVSYESDVFIFSNAIYKGNLSISGLFCVAGIVLGAP